MSFCKFAPGWWAERHLRPLPLRRTRTIRQPNTLRHHNTLHQPRTTRLLRDTYLRDTYLLDT
jgi:hypothetical protein